MCAVDPSNVVALCHRGRALLMMQQHEAARADLSTALELLQETMGGSVGGPCHVAHVELNRVYWQQRIQGLLDSLPAAGQAGR